MASLDELIAKAKKQPYELTLPSGAVVSIAHPSLATWQEARADLAAAEFFEKLGVSAADAQALDEALKDAPLGASDLLYRDLANHFGRGN